MRRADLWGERPGAIVLPRSISLRARRRRPIAAKAATLPSRSAASTLERARDVGIPALSRALRAGLTSRATFICSRCRLQTAGLFCPARRGSGMGAALPLQAPPDAAAGRGSSHQQWPDKRKHTEGKSVALHSPVRIEGVRGSNPLSSTFVSAFQSTHSQINSALYSSIIGSDGSRS